MAALLKHEITQLLSDWGDGDETALEKLIPLVFSELHRRAHKYMSNERAGHTLQTAGLINEVYLRLIDLGKVHLHNRRHFFALSARLMREILVDYARSHKASKRGGDIRKVPLDEALLISQELEIDLVAFDKALTKLETLYQRNGLIAEMLFFGELDVKEIAEVLKVSDATVYRDLRFAKRWLKRELEEMG